jgi:hypothetical protein
MVHPRHFDASLVVVWAAQSVVPPGVKFPYKGRPIGGINDSAWKRARVDATEPWRVDKGEDTHPGFARLRTARMI